MRPSFTLIAVLAAAALLGACGTQDAEAGSPTGQAQHLTDNDSSLRGAIDAWHADAGDPPAGQAPDDVLEPSRYLQERVRFLAKHVDFAEQTIALLPTRLAGQVRGLTAAARKLGRLSAGDHRVLPESKPRPLGELVGYYEDAERRYGVAADYLAAINLVETKFGRVKSNSVAGAQGPMQFLPSTWRIYGDGGNIRSARDAIPAAARLLRDSGAPGNYARALHAYNHSKLYVTAVSRYAKLIAKDPYVLRILYCWAP